MPRRRTKYSGGKADEDHKVERIPFSSLCIHKSHSNYVIHSNSEFLLQMRQNGIFREARDKCGDNYYGNPRSSKVQAEALIFRLRELA